MAESYEDKRLRLLQEKALLTKGFEHPGTQMIFIKLREMARASMHDYDLCNFDTEQGREMAHRIQARRYVILTEIPKMIDEIINVDIPPENGKKQWRFNTWLDHIRKNLRRFFNPFAD
jgi:hypothetical protein